MGGASTAAALGDNAALLCPEEITIHCLKELINVAGNLQ